LSLQICEIFKSLQGESTWAGRPCIFVRLTGCNLRCRWCDTPYAYEGGESLSSREVLERIDSLDCGLAHNLIEFTGGEPLLQPQAVELMNALARSGRTVLVETNGSCDISVLAPEVIAIVDMKGRRAVSPEKWTRAIWSACDTRDEVKFVIADRQDWTYMLCLLPRIDASRNVVNVSPLFGGVARPSWLAGCLRLIWTRV